MYHDTFGDLAGDISVVRWEWQDAMDTQLRDLSRKYDYGWSNESMI
jgi:hypothetical protein